MSRIPQALCTPWPGAEPPARPAPASERAGARAHAAGDLLSALDDGELVRRACGGERAAFDALYRRHARGVHAVLLTRVRAEEAEDLVQDVFLRAWRALATLREPEHVVAWLFAIARREAHAARQARVETTTLPEELAARAHDGAAAREEALRVLAALRELPASHRETLSLRLLGGYSGAEIARISGRTHGAVRVSLHRGLELLRERLTRGGGQ